MRLLIVEDSSRLRTSIAKALRRSGYVVDESEDGEDGLWRAKEFVYDGLILDLMLPKLDGLDVLAALRKQGNETPALLLSARNEVADRVAGLRLGADDYLGKPFALEELLARVDALCRRSFGKRSPTVRIGDLEVNLDAKTATRGSDKLELTAREFRLLRSMFNRVTDEAHMILFGGLTALERDLEAGTYTQDGQVPFTNQCSVVVRDPAGRFQQY